MEPGISPLQQDPRRRRRLDQFAVFEVEGKTFRERRYGFEKWSKSPFTQMFAIPEDIVAKGDVGSEDNPIRLSGCTVAEFESLLDAIYAPDEQIATLDKDDWISVLKLARLWNMPQLASRAVDELSANLSPMEKITMGRATAHRVVQWIREGYTEIIGDLNEMTLDGLATVLGWETTARVLWAVKEASFKFQPSLANLSPGDVVDEIVQGEFGAENLAQSREAFPDPTYVEAIPSLLRITITQEQPVPRRAGTASIISFAPDGVYVSRDYKQAPTRVLQDFGYDAGGWRVEKHVRLVGDTTGCGRSDIIGFGDAGVYVSRNNGDGTFAPAKLVLPDLGYNSGWRIDKHLRYVVDLRKKGFVDIVGFGDGGVYVALNNGNGTFSAPRIVLPDFGCTAGGWTLERHLRFMADVTGNGLPDIIGFGETAVLVALNNGDGTFQNGKIATKHFTPGSGWAIENHPRTLADVTGDGRPDIVGFFDDGVHVSVNAGNGTFHPPTRVLHDLGRTKGNWSVAAHPRCVADVTGDGRGDIVGFSVSNVFAALNNGDGSFQTIEPLVYGFGEYKGYRVGKHLRLAVDLTGNGAADIIGFAEDAIWVSYNDGKGRCSALEKLRDYSSGDAESRSVNKTVRWITNLYA